MKKLIFIFGTAVIIGLLFVSFTEIIELYMPVNIKQAYEKGTRSEDGKPGPSYWQNKADYKIQIDFEPESRLISGNEEITYYNNSPDDLSKIVMHLYPNLYKKGNKRDFEVESADESSGINITEMIVSGKKRNPSSSNRSLYYDHTLLSIYLNESLKSGEKIKLNISWNYKLNEHSHMRTGVVDSSSFFAAYFFPRVAVYDDIDGWNMFKYMGDTEFYNDYGNFEVSIKLPKNYIVWATGVFQNPEEVLNTKYLDRYKKALQSDEIISIIKPKECTQNNITVQNDYNVWKFSADNVTDFVFASSDHYVWEGVSLIVDKETNRRVFTDAAYNKQSENFYKVVKIARDALDFMSNEFPGIPYPYPKVTVFNGLDAMEYPMMVNDMEADEIQTVKVTAHEILHSYMPFYVGTNETKYAWMDEGFTSFYDYLFHSKYVHYEKAGFYFLDEYRNDAGHTLDAPVFTSSEYLKRPAYTYNSYPKPAGFLITLNDLFGDELFKEIIIEFMRRWKSKHPTPYDLFYTLNDISQQNINWLIKAWIFEFGYADLSIKGIEKENEEYKIIVEKIGGFPTPVHLRILYSNGDTEMILNKASVWEKGNKEFIIKKKTFKKIKSVELLDPTLIDANASNNFYNF